MSGEIDPGTRAFLTRIQLAEEDIAEEQLQRNGPLEAGDDLVDYASFGANHGRGVVWQGWTGPPTGSIERLTDVRMAFPTTEDAVGFLAGFGDEIARNQGLTEFDAVTIGEESRAFERIRAGTPEGGTSRYVFIWRRGDLVAFDAIVISSDDRDFARGVATDLCVRAGEKIDRALGIEPA